MEQKERLLTEDDKARAIILKEIGGWLDRRAVIYLSRGEYVCIPLKDIETLKRGEMPQ